MLSLEQWMFWTIKTWGAKYERMRDERCMRGEEEWIEKYSNKYLGQTILAKIFPLQGWCRGNFFPSSISDPILTNILDKFPNCTKILVVGLHSLSRYKTWFLPLELLCSAPLNHLPLEDVELNSNKVTHICKRKSIEISRKKDSWQTNLECQQRRRM